MRVLVACEFSGVVRDAFAARGHDAWSCDLLPSERPGQHIQGDVLDVLDRAWDLMVAHPPCTYLSKMGARWNHRPGRLAMQQEALEFVLALARAPVPCIAIENSIGALSRLWRKPDQIVQPYQFGEPYSKATCLWLRGLSPLAPTRVLTSYQPWVQGTYVRDGLKLAGGTVRSPHERSRTFAGLAAAMAQQWGGWRQLRLEWVA